MEVFTRFSAVREGDRCDAMHDQQIEGDQRLCIRRGHINTSIPLQARGLYET
jgi:hypothetical protein